MSLKLSFPCFLELFIIALKIVFGAGEITVFRDLNFLINFFELFCALRAFKVYGFNDE